MEELNCWYNFNYDSLTGTFDFTNLSVIPRIGGIPSMGDCFDTMLDEIKEGYLLLPEKRFSSNTLMDLIMSKFEK